MSSTTRPSREPSPLYRHDNTTRDSAVGSSTPDSAVPIENDERHAEESEAQSNATASTQLVPQVSNKENSPARSTQRKRSYGSVVATWWREATAALLLVAAAIASFATLYPYQGRPLPEWPYSITIGALLSAYSVVLRLAATFLLAEGLAQMKWRWFEESSRPLRDLVLHDDATKGPIGAVSLLWRLPLPRTWQWLGCVLILITLLVGPFTQQVLQYQPCPVPVTGAAGQAEIPRTSIFIGGGIHQSASEHTLTMPEQIAINAGIFTPGQITPTCKSGNCTFSSYNSLGYCSRCDDVSSEVIVQTANLTANETGLDDSIYGSVLRTTTTLTTIGWINNTFEDINVTNALGGNPFDYSGRGSNYAILSDTPGLYMPFNFIFGLTAIRSENGIISPVDPATGKAPSACGGTDTDQSWRCRGYAAANCSLYPCIRTYSTEVSNGVFQETVVQETAQDSPLISSRSLWPDDRMVYSVLNTSCPTPEQSSALQKLGFEIPDNDTWVTYELNLSNLDLGQWPADRKVALSDFEQLDQDLMNAGCVYVSDYEFNEGLGVYIQNSFAGTLYGMRGNFINQVIQFSGSQLLQTAYNFGNFSLEHVDSLMRNMSLSLTNHMRLNPGTQGFNSSASALGHASVTKTCLDVKWAWLSLPAAVAVFSLAFFTGVMLSSGHLENEIRTWKSSPLPLLFRGPWVHSSSDGGGLPETASEHIDDMKKASRRTDLRLVKDEDGRATLRARSKDSLESKEP